MPFILFSFKFIPEILEYSIKIVYLADVSGIISIPFAENINLILPIFVKNFLYEKNRIGMILKVKIAQIRNTKQSCILRMSSSLNNDIVNTVIVIVISVIWDIRL